MIAVIDYGMGNLRSVEKALEKLGADVDVVDDAERLGLAEKIVLPGVGSFKDTMDGLRSGGLMEAVSEFISSGKPYLGICVGLQVIFDRSEEGGRHKGMGLVKGDVKRFRPGKGLKVPHMGWNRVKMTTGGRKCPLFKGLVDGSYFYFDHSYYAAPRDEGVVSGVTDYGADFASAVWSENIYAVQFHIEKSQANGLRMLENFIRL
jgi:glutamine amidotransferase